METTSTQAAIQRRKHTSEFKAQVLRQCEQPGASVASVALSHGLNANLVHRWRRLARAALIGEPTIGQTHKRTRSLETPAPAPAFIVLPKVDLRAASQMVASSHSATPVCITTDTPASNPTPTIDVELACGAAQIRVRWPTNAAIQCADWLRCALPELLRPPPPRSRPPRGSTPSPSIASLVPKRTRR